MGAEGDLFRRASLDYLQTEFLLEDSEFRASRFLVDELNTALIVLIDVLKARVFVDEQKEVFVGEWKGIFIGEWKEVFIDDCGTDGIRDFIEEWIVNFKDEWKAVFIGEWNEVFIADWIGVLIDECRRVFMMCGGQSVRRKGVFTDEWKMVFIDDWNVVDKDE